MGGNEKRPGRPLSEPKRGRKSTISVAVAPDVKRGLNDASRASGRSLSQEAELRLERSLRTSGHLREILELAYGPAWTGIILLLGHLMRHAIKRYGLAPDDDWMSDASAFNQALREARAAVDELLAGRPPGEVHRVDNESPEHSARRLLMGLAETERPYLALEPLRKQVGQAVLDALTRAKIARSSEDGE